MSSQNWTIFSHRQVSKYEESKCDLIQLIHVCCLTNKCFTGKKIEKGKAKVTEQMTNKENKQKSLSLKSPRGLESHADTY